MGLARVFLLCFIPMVFVMGQFNWQSRDKFDEIIDSMKKVTATNCKALYADSLFLPEDSVSHLPHVREIYNNPIFPNRTNLLHVHNMALARSFFFSFILQRAADELEPGFMYYFLSTIADVAANKFINNSAVYFAPNMSFTPSYKGFFNKTLPLFAPRAFRSDDFNDPFHLERVSTLNTIEAEDLGAIPPNSKVSNYSDKQYGTNEWYNAWLPDITTRHDSKTTYYVVITHANGTNETFLWHGPPGSSDGDGPVKWIPPYFDCGRSNKWLVAASAPFPDIYPRHTQWRHIEIPLYVGVVVMEMDFDRIDINQCPVSKGNPRSNMFADTARCKKDTTECEPIHGYGFRRGGYQCRCRPGYRLPRVVRNPYSGEVVERATKEEYEKGFHCNGISFRMYLPTTRERVSKTERMRYIGRQELRSMMNNLTGPRIEPSALLHFMIYEVTNDTCHHFMEKEPEKLVLRGDVAFGKEERLDNEARSALRLANFISAFLQIVNPKDMFAEFRVPDKPLSADQMLGEVLSLVASNFRIRGAGIFFDRNQFPNRTLFAPYAYFKDEHSRKFFVKDLAGESPKKSYLNRDWFKKLKVRWSTNTDDLETYTTKIQIRYNSSGYHSIHYDQYPLQYKAAGINHGHWTSPFFDCGGFHEDWLITYAAPFFGWDKIKHRLEFKGVVTVSMKLSELEINQCEDEYYVENAFKDTHKCDRRSTRCVPILGRAYASGGYKCECLQGYEYPFLDNFFTYFDGEIMENEYEKLYYNEPSRYDTQKCRIAAAGTVQSNLVFIFILAIFSRLCAFSMVK